LRFQARRGGFWPGGDLDRMVEERLALIRTPSGVHYERRSASGKYLEILFNSSTTAASSRSIATSPN